MQVQSYNEIEIANKLQSLAGWHYVNACLNKKFVFKNFSEAFAFMTRVAIEAEKLNHHPNWSNVYNQVEINLNTHSAKGITELDFVLAEKINQLT